jgi:crossover junction endodeoxyribonuclease RusA
MESESPRLPVAGAGSLPPTLSSISTITVPPGIPLLDCSVHGTPIQQGKLASSKSGHLYDANQKRLKPWRQDVSDIAAAEKFEAEPWRGPVGVIVHFWLLRPASHYGTGKNAGVLKDTAPKYHAGYPDVDKLLRSILDSLTVARVFADDKQVAWAFPVKRWAAPKDPSGADIFVLGITE